MRFVRQCLLCVLLAPLAAIGQSLAQQGVATPSQRVFASWVEHSFPALAVSKHVPENLYLGYVVNEQFQVLQYSAIVRPDPRPISQDIAQMFPSVSTGGSSMAGIAELPLAFGQSVGVIWVVVPTGTLG